MMKKSFYAPTTTKHDFQFTFVAKNETDLTYITGSAWKEFARVYRLDVGKEIYFNMGTHSLATRVVTGNNPITHPSNLLTFFLILLFRYIITFEKLKKGAIFVQHITSWVIRKETLWTFSLARKEQPLTIK